jgi:hypothetical protein
VLNYITVIENIKQGREEEAALKRIMQNYIFVAVNIMGGRKQVISH